MAERRFAHVIGFATALCHHRIRGACQHDAPIQILLAQNLDRKSTRLNSSHGYISYAVFCLKKKKPCDDTPSLILPSHNNVLFIHPHPSNYNSLATSATPSTNLLLTSIDKLVNVLVSIT